jgi:hypothetical protein
MDDERWEPGMVVLDRRAVVGRSAVARPEAGRSADACPVAGRSADGRPLPRRPADASLPPSLCGLPPRNVPALVAGATAITVLVLWA